MNHMGERLKVVADNKINTQTGLPGNNRKKLLINQGIFSLGHFIIDLYMNLLPPILPLISRNMGLSLALAATVLSAKSITSSFLQPYLGYLIDQKQNKWLLPVSVLWVTVTMGLVGVVDNYYLLLILSALSGIGSALYHPLGSTYSNLFAEHNKGLAVSIFSTGGSLGFAVAPAIVMPVVIYFGLSGTLLLMLPGLAATLLFILFNIYYLKETEPVVTKRSGDRKDKVLAISTNRSRLSGFQRVGKHKLAAVTVLSLIVILRSIVHSGMVTFLPYYFQQLGYNELVGGRWLSLFLLCGALAGVFGGYISDRYEREKVTVISLIAAACFLFIFLNSAGLFSLIVLIVSGGMLLLSIPVTIIYAQEILPGNKGFVAGLMMGLCYGIAGLTIAPLGIAADLWGLKWVMGLFVILLLAGTLLFLMMAKLKGR